MTAFAAPWFGAVFACLAGIAQAGQIDSGALDHLPTAQIVILGEIHDNPAHHRNQARAVAAVHPSALVFEMLTPEQVSAAEGVDRRDSVRLGQALGWAGTGWPDFALYAPIFAAAPEAELFGAAIPVADVRRAMTEGAAPVFGAGAATFGLDRPLPAAEQATREAAQKAAHCGMLPDTMLPGMVAAQRLRDAAFARTTLLALRETGGPVVVIAGDGHADRMRGIPVYLAAADPGVTVLSVGQVERGETGNPPFDLWLETDTVPRGDPCADFRMPKQ